jgi:hypothetical protein
MNPKCLVDRPIVRTAHVSIVIDMHARAYHTHSHSNVRTAIRRHARTHWSTHTTSAYVPVNAAEPEFSMGDAHTDTAVSQSV